jgi:hypothetical protein
MRVVTMLAIVGANLFGAAIQAGPVRSRELERQYAEARHELETKYADWSRAGGSRGFPKALERAFRITGEWAAEVLNEHPQLSAAQFTDALQQLDPPRPCESQDCAEEYHLTAEAVPLGGDAFAVSASYPRSGTFFVIARGKDGAFRLAWHVKDVARRHLALRDEIGRWAWIEFGWGDGPLAGTVHSLPPGRSGKPRFYVDATASAMAGGTFGSQIGIWEWNGREAQPLFLQSYLVSVDTGPMHLEGDTLVIPTKGSYRSFFTCGMCKEPEVTLRIGVAPDGVRVLGKDHAVPELDAIDELWDRVIRRANADDLAAPPVIATLRDLAKELAAAQSESDRPYSLGMLGDWNVTPSNGKRVVLFSTDALDCRTLTFTLDDRLYVSSVEIRSSCQ